MEGRFEAPRREAARETDPYQEFMAIHEERWEPLIEAGIPLLKQLVESGDTERAESVRSTLRAVRNQIDHSQAEDKDKREALMARITQGLQANRGY